MFGRPLIDSGLPSSKFGIVAAAARVLKTCYVDFVNLEQWVRSFAKSASRFLICLSVSLQIDRAIDLSNAGTIARTIPMRVRQGLG